MNWNRVKSVQLSKLAVVLFGILLVAMDVGAYWLVTWFLGQSDMLGGVHDGCILLICIYSCSIPAWITLVALWRLLRSIGRGEIFTVDNIHQLRLTSWCCSLAGLILLAGSFFYPPLLVLALAAGFMGLIVRIVKNVFVQALAMKDELDLTV